MDMVISVRNRIKAGNAILIFVYSRLLTRTILLFCACSSAMVRWWRQNIMLLGVINVSLFQPYKILKAYNIEAYIIFALFKQVLPYCNGKRAYYAPTCKDTYSSNFSGIMSYISGFHYTHFVRDSPCNQECLEM